MKKFKDARNGAIEVIPDTIVVPLELEEHAWQIANSIGKSGTSDNDGNFLRNMNVVADVHLTDTNNWFLVDSGLSGMQLKWASREPLTNDFIAPTAKDRNYYYGAYMRHDKGWSDWRWIYGHEVA